MSGSLETSERKYCICIRVSCCLLASVLSEWLHTCSQQSQGFVCRYRIARSTTLCLGNVDSDLLAVICLHTKQLLLWPWSADVHCVGALRRRALVIAAPRRTVSNSVRQQWIMEQQECLAPSVMQEDAIPRHKMNPSFSGRLHGIHACYACRTRCGERT